MRLQLLLLAGSLCGGHAAQVCPGTPANHSAPTTHICANECCSHSFYSNGGPTVAGYGCKLASGTCCSPGAKEAPSKTLPNCLIIGDSVSEGYVGHVASLLATKCKVQHGPWCGGGSAGNVAGALPCVKSWLTTAMNVEVDWDVVTFNFGLHDLGNNTTAALDLYQEHLQSVTDILTATGAAKKVAYALTTPQMQFEVNMSDPIVSLLNKRATTVMAAAKPPVPTIDLYSRVKAKCGQTYIKCPGFCDSAGPGGTCTYHYTYAGYQWIAEAMADEITKLLPRTSQ